ncbi:MAG: isoprenylcysteine carboxylmethyltransferase family protein [Allomuricauda sp.]|nr:MAG: isoprenylcysteine carboxylmethyltransferase family protein [Allomuricauda sp.]
MKIKILPPLVMVIFGALMYALDSFLPVGEFDFFGRKVLVYLIAAMAFIIMAIALIQFLKAKTTTNPIQLDKTTALVTSGIYDFTRNPMYLTMLLLLIAWGLRLGNAFNTLLAAGFVYYMNHFQIKYEEEALLQQFGKEYQLYKKAVRRWF